MAQRSIREALDSYLKEVEDAISKNMDENGRNASGRSVNSLRRVIESDDHAYLEGLTSYLVMERGRKAGKVPYGFRDIIRQWIIDKGIAVRPIPSKTGRAKQTPYERGLNSMAFLIARKIMLTGTRLHRLQGYDDIFTSAIEAMMPRLEQEVALWAGVQIDRIHQKAL